jgi:ABC-type Fe3+-siderophore transport system permease subunit
VAVATMLLAGIAVNPLVGALTGLLTFAATDTQLRSITFWSMGRLGGSLLLGADLLARTLLASAELLLGIVTALVDTPFFLWMLLRDRRAGGL